VETDPFKEDDDEYKVLQLLAGNSNSVPEHILFLTA